MSNAITPNPNRRLIAMALMLGVVVVGLGSLYIKATQDDPPQWVALAMPLMMALFGLVYWLYPEMSRLTPSWRPRIITFFFGLSALMLTLYFV